jgi:hypothetical protein
MLRRRLVDGDAGIGARDGALPGRRVGLLLHLTLQDA